MRLLSVAERELRAAARHKGLYHLRWLTAAGAFALLIWLGWAFDAFQNKSLGPTVFQTFATVIFVYCLFVGAAGTADCISRERREGTLGLLFLTNLNSTEIVAGKVLSNGLALMYSLLAIFPIMALPVLIGGITFDQFWRTALALVSGLCFAIAAGFTASSVCVRQFPAIALATGLTLVWGLGLVGVVEGMRRLGLPRSTAGYVAMFSPLHTLLSANESGRMLYRSQFWISLAAVTVLSWTWLALAVWWVGRSWRDRPKSAGRWNRFRVGVWLRERGRAARTTLRRRLLEINPFFWLAARQRVSAPVFMVLTVILVLITVGLTAPFFAKVMRVGAVGPLVGTLFAWVWTGLAIHALVLYYGATVASQRLAEDKQSGALELILSTPITERFISRGLWLAYGRRMLFPVLIAVLVHCFFIWQVLALMVIDPPSGKLAVNVTPGQIFWSAILDRPLQGKVLDWQFGFILRGILFALVVLAATWITLGWLGRWLGLRMKHPGFAPMTAVALAVVPPMLLFGLLCYVCEEWKLFRLPDHQFMPLMMWLALGLALGNSLFWSAWAATHLRRDFRTTVTSRYEPPAVRDWWRAGWRMVVRFTLAGTALALILAVLILSFYGYQNWRNQRRWTVFQKQLQQRGESLDLSPILPGPVPAGENFALTPAFQNLVNAKSADKATVALFRESLNQSGVDRMLSGPAPVLPWTQQSNASFNLQLAWIKPKGSTSANQTRAQAAAEVWAGLQPLQKDLAELAMAARLPRFQATSNQTADAVYGLNPRELAALEQLNFLFQLRACALLELDREPEAGADVLTALQIAQLARQSPDLKSSMRVQVMLARTLQPVWEGLAEHRWSATQLAAFQGELARFDLLSDHTNAIRRVTLAYLETWRAMADGKTAARASVPQGGGVYVRRTEWAWQPRSWWYDNSIQLHQAAQNAMARVDFAAGRVTDEHDWRDLNGLPLDANASQLFQQWPWWGAGPVLVSFSQTSVNQAIIACALERYRLAHDAHPESLDQLVPAYLNSIPRDISRGRPMFYQQDSQDNYVLRGAGADSNIAQGQGPSDDWIWSFTTPTNVSPSSVIRRR